MPRRAGAGGQVTNELPFSVFADVKCPVCNKVIPSDNVELHLVVCLTRPRIAYNGTRCSLFGGVGRSVLSTSSTYLREGGMEMVLRWVLHGRPY